MAERRAECWKRHILDQLKARDRVQRQSFEEIVLQCESHLLSLSLTVSVQIHNDDLSLIVFR